MSSTYITELNIHKVRHLRNIIIPLSESSRRNLILTGKNGSGKTSVLNSLVSYLTHVAGKTESEDFIRAQMNYYEKQLSKIAKTESERQNKLNNQKQFEHWKSRLSIYTDGVTVTWPSVAELKEKYANGKYIMAYFGDSRKISVDISNNIEKVNLKKYYSIDERPSRDLVKYLVNLKTTQAFAQTKGDQNKAREIETWFVRFEDILGSIYNEPSLYLDFDIETFQFFICMDNREKFEFNQMSMGYAAVFDIIGDLVMRMEAARDYNLEGVVLIDEIETHLHVELQKKIVPILTELFPNIQFVLTTHSPFVLSSAKNATIYDLEKHTLVENGLTNLPYAGIVEGYFSVDTLSEELRNKFDEYKKILLKENRSPKDSVKLRELEVYLDEVPDYLALDFSEEYERLKLEYR